MKLAQMIWKLGRVTASSPAIFLVHGNKFCKEIWIPVVKHLSRLCTADGQSAEVIAVDLPGSGDSRPIDFDLPADWPTECLRGLRQVVVEHGRVGRPLFGVGHSFGGTTLMVCEADKPGTFTRLLSYEPALFPPGTIQPYLYSEEERQLVNSFPLIKSVCRQTAMFESRHAAFEYYRRIKRFDRISDDVIEVYVQHGLEDVPDKPGHVQVKLRLTVEADQLVGLRFVTDDDVVAMRAPCVFGYGSLSTWGETMCAPDTASWVAGLAQKFSGALGGPWETSGATHLVTLEKTEQVAYDIQRLVWRETACADKTPASKL